MAVRPAVPIDSMSTFFKLVTVSCPLFSHVPTEKSDPYEKCPQLSKLPLRSSPWEIQR